MFTIKNAVLTANGTFVEQFIKDAKAADGTKLSDCVLKLSSKKNGLNFHNPKDGALVCYGRFSKAVKQALMDKTLSFNQLMAFGKLSESEFEGETYYSLTIPDEMRGGTALGTVKTIAAAAKPLAKKAVSIADISSMLVLE